jgi:hypothetical protein
VPPKGGTPNAAFGGTIFQIALFNLSGKRSGAGHWFCLLQACDIGHFSCLTMFWGTNAARREL